MQTSAPNTPATFQVQQDNCYYNVATVLLGLDLTLFYTSNSFKTSECVQFPAGSLNGSTIISDVLLHSKYEVSSHRSL